MTAVEWLMNRLEFAGIKDLDLCDDIYLQAKAMEREQIIDAVNLPKEKRWYDAKKHNSSGEQYYNETYGKQ